MNFFLDLTKKNLGLKLKKKLGLDFFFGPYQIGGPRRVPNSPRLWAGPDPNSRYLLSHAWIYCLILFLCLIIVIFIVTYLITNFSIEDSVAAISPYTAHHT